MCVSVSVWMTSSNTQAQVWKRENPSSWNEHQMGGSWVTYPKSQCREHRGWWACGLLQVLHGKWRPSRQKKSLPVLVPPCCCDKPPWPRQLYKSLFWSTVSKGWAIHGWEAQQQEAGAAAGETWECTSSTYTHSRESELEVEQGYKIAESTACDILPPVRPHLLNLPKHLHQLGNHMFNYLGLWGTFLI